MDQEEAEDNAELETVPVIEIDSLQLQRLVSHSAIMLFDMHIFVPQKIIIPAPAVYSRTWVFTEENDIMLLLQDLLKLDCEGSEDLAIMGAQVCNSANHRPSCKGYCH